MKKGSKMSIESRKKLSISHLGHKHSEETKRKMSATRKGEKKTKESVKRRVESRRKNGCWFKNLEAFKEKIRNANTGRKLTGEQKKKIGLSQKGKKVSSETKRKISLAKKGKKHSAEARKKMSLSKMGEKHPMWKGRKIDSKGYVLLYSPNHPYKSKADYVLEHRLVIEKHLGRYLLPSEIGHHIGNRKDNRLHMLMAFASNSAHLRFHHNPDNDKPEEIIFDGRNLQVFYNDISKQKKKIERRVNKGGE